MGRWTYFMFILLLMDIYLVECKRGSSSGSWGRRGSSRGQSNPDSGGGWFGIGSKKTSAPSPSSSAGFQKPAEVKPATSYGWQKPAEVAKPAGGSTYGWQNPGTNTAKVGTNNQPNSHIGPGGYPVQQGIQKSPSPGVNPPPYSATNPHGTSYNPGNTRIAPPAYSPGAPPAYSGPKKQVINNHYHYGSPPAYSASQYGMSSSYYPQQSHFGYPGGYYGNSRPSYGGMGLFSGGGGGYGYSGGGSWGGYPSYGSKSGMGSTTKGLLIGAAGGYLASSLVNRLSNPWGYHGHGYGNNYYDRYRQEERRPDSAPTTATPPYDPTKDWINCVAFDPATKETLINPNCTCTVTVVTDPATGQNTSHHDCTPYGQGQMQPIVPQQAIPVYGVNNPPPSFNGNLPVGSSYAGGYPVGPPAAGQPVNPAESSTPQTEPLVGDSVAHKRMEFYSQLEKIVNMGRFSG